MQRRAAEDLRKLVTDALVERGFLYEGAKAFATPRRLALHVAGLPARGEAVREERRGPRVGAPDAAVQGFLKGAGLTSLDQATTITDPKKGEFYLAVIERPGRETLDVLAEILPGIIRNFPWPKSMRWGAASAQPGSLRWVRPLQSIVATFGPETENPEVVPFSVDGIAAGTTTYGHRFLAPGPFEVRRFDDYVTALERAHVILDADRRKDIILHDARDLAFARGLDLVEDDGLLEEVAGLVEKPVVLMGSFDERFLEIPSEAIRATIRANQKCFVLRKSGTEELAPAFLLVSNLVASDGGAAITAGNERVVRARLSDARFFWETDKATKLEDRLPKLDTIVFHEKLGTQGERIARIAALAKEIAPLVGADPALAERAARLAKADLVTEMVGEFPELQGLMGRKYAALQGEHPSVAAAIEEHYKPVGPSDRVPTDPVSIAVASPTSSIRWWAFGRSTRSRPGARIRSRCGGRRWCNPRRDRAVVASVADRAVERRFNGGRCGAHRGSPRLLRRPPQSLPARSGRPPRPDRRRLRPAPPGRSPARRPPVEALGAFLGTDDGKNLLAGYKRAANILRIEEKKDGRAYDAAPDAARAAAGQPEERALAEALESARAEASAAVAAEDFAGAMRALSRLRAPVDAFFETVTVNADDPAYAKTASSFSMRSAPPPAKSPTFRASRVSRIPSPRDAARGEPGRLLLNRALGRRLRPRAESN